MPKRPWYLVAALIAGVVIGTGTMNEGCMAIEFYRGGQVTTPNDFPGITDAEVRSHLIAADEQIAEIMVQAKNRLLPLGIASFLLGAAMVIFSMRAMSGSNAARNTLMQVVLVQMLVVGGGYFLTADLQRAEIKHLADVYDARARETFADKKGLEQSGKLMHAVFKVAPPVGLAFQCLARVLILVALTRPRSREFYAAAAGFFSER